MSDYTAKGVADVAIRLQQSASMLANIARAFEATGVLGEVCSPALQLRSRIEYQERSALAYQQAREMSEFARLLSRC